MKNNEGPALPVSRLYHKAIENTNISYWLDNCQMEHLNTYVPKYI